MNSADVKGGRPPTPEELKQWREAAEKAKLKGPWYVDCPNDDGKPEVFDKRHLCYVCAVAMTEDATHIANMNPLNCMRLIARVEELESFMRDMVEQYHFDVTQERFACHDCDMGDSGRPTDSRGHDIDCVFGMARAALEGGGTPPSGRRGGT